MIDKVFEKVISPLMRALKPVQVCWLCVILTASGVLYAVGNFAKADDFNRWVKRQTEESIITNRRSQCGAILENNRPAASMYADRIINFQRDYEELSGGRFKVPECADL